MSKSILHLDLHPLRAQGADIDAALEGLFVTAEKKRVYAAEIIPGKGSGQLMKRVKRFLQRKDMQARYTRMRVDPTNHGRLFVYFR